MAFGLRRAKGTGKLFVQLVSKISDLCGPDQTTNVTDRQTDRQTTCDRNTALCTIVHRAVKISGKVAVGVVRDSLKFSVHHM